MCAQDSAQVVHPPCDFTLSYLSRIGILLLCVLRRLRRRRWLCHELLHPHQDIELSFQTKLTMFQGRGTSRVQIDFRRSTRLRRRRSSLFKSSIIWRESAWDASNMSPLSSPLGGQEKRQSHVEKLLKRRRRKGQSHYLFKCRV